MSKEELIEKIFELPVSAQKKAERFIENLYKVEVIRKRKRKIKNSGDEFIGLWKNRNDMKDSTAWKRKIRNEEWKIKI